MREERGERREGRGGALKLRPELMNGKAP